ncbi:MAG: CAP domain-containing protein [Spirochaetes bacterium]|jgi:hypothetical protein|nr:CAP domain-containing protein [Spirochaetota bacterium]
MRKAALMTGLFCFLLVIAAPGDRLSGEDASAFNAADIKPTAEEMKLYDLIMRYRAGRGLPSIALSPSLTHVAQVHARDLTDNRPAKGECNMHSWSDKGKWSACCYTRDHRQAACMWNKPRELTPYPGNGYEISNGAWGVAMNAEIALKGWQGSPAHNAVIINEGIWSGGPWKAVGVGIYGNYAVVWFGREADPAGSTTP